MFINEIIPDLLKYTKIELFYLPLTNPLNNYLKLVLKMIELNIYTKIYHIFLPNYILII